MRVGRAERIGNRIILLLFASAVLWPIGTILATAFGPPTIRAEREGGRWHPGNFAVAWTEGGFGQYLFASFSVTATVVLFAVVCSVLAGYAFGTMRFRGSTALFYVFLLGIMVPTEAIIVPLHYDLRTFGLTDTLWGVALPQIAQSIAFGTYWMRAWFRAAPAGLIDAARLDGAGSLRILLQVLVPNARPAITTMTVLIVMWTWNEFLIPLAMSPSGAFRTAPFGLTRFDGQYTEGTALLAAGAILVALPVVVLYMLLQRHFIRGMLDGGLKG